MADEEHRVWLMATFRVQYRIDKADQVIEANIMSESDTSYVFYDANGNTVALVPRDVVLTVMQEGSTR